MRCSVPSAQSPVADGGTRPDGLPGMRVLVTGWPSFLHGEATAGDVLAMEAARRALRAAGIRCDLAWSPVLYPGELTLADAEPSRYTHLVFCCGPVHGWQLEQLHRRYAGCRRIAVGVSVISSADPAAAGFHVLLPRDGNGFPPRCDLAGGVTVPPVPVAGIILAPDQPEYGLMGQNEAVSAELGSWLAGRDCARVVLDTRLDTRHWRHATTPAQLEAAIRRLDLVVTTRLHGLVLALKNGVPALAIDPIAGGAKVTAQALAWRWPAVVTARASLQPAALTGPPVLDRADLDRHWQWCLSPSGVDRARTAACGPSLTAGLLAALRS
jgi:hypothetical protein